MHGECITPLHFSPNLWPAHLTSLHTHAKMGKYFGLCRDRARGNFLPFSELEYTLSLEDGSLPSIDTRV